MLFPVILIGYYLRETNLDNINLLSEVNFSLILGYNVDEARASICPKQAMAGPTNGSSSYYRRELSESGCIWNPQLPVKLKDCVYHDLCYQ